MKLQSFVTCFGIALSLPFSLNAFAQQNVQLAEAYQPGQADEIIVTASRSPMELQDALASTTVITRDQIDRSQAQDLYGLLRTVPGVRIMRTGGPGGATTVSLRGGEANGTLVLLDGVNIESATLGEGALEQISLNQIDHIEIIRGPKSSLYGSSAMSGVVQIFTRKAALKNGVTYSAGAGSDKTYTGSVSASGVTKTSSFNVTASHINSQGFDSQYGDDHISGNPRYDYDKDGYRRSAVSVNLEQKFGSNLKGNFLLNRGEGAADYDEQSVTGITLPYSTYKTMVASGALTFENALLTSKLQYGHVMDSSEQNNHVAAMQAVDYSLIETDRSSGEWENSLRLAKWLTLNFGTDYTHEEVSGSVAYSQTKRDNFGGYIHSRMNAGRFSWSLGLRHDNNEQFGSWLTGDTAFGLEVADGVHASLSYGTAFKAPSFNDLYWPQSQYTGGNPNLQPEQDKTYELGVDSYQDWGMLSAHVYKTFADNLIQWAPSVSDSNFWTPSNVGRAKIEGSELQYGSQLWSIDWKASFTYEKVIDNVTGEDLIRRPRRRAALDLDRQIGKWSVGTTLLAQSQQHDSTQMGESVVDAGFGQMDLRLTYQVTPELKVRGKINNVFDRHYVEAADYNVEGRFVMLLVDYTPK